ncbi:uncharacterized protein LOC132742175 [Ruditapes philippinarum]|uniref:uncharacterized protein LOC132742175 n=1 Tax=Ruditapes philippinarum TaxID=129788 RepID=UPI00295AD6F2|nr:uncharacterized protein LOC132742175 [Ruditapes philippinarum]
MLNVSRVFEGRYVTLLSQWKYASTYPQYKEQLSAANIYVSVLSSNNPDNDGKNNSSNDDYNDIEDNDCDDAYVVDYYHVDDKKDYYRYDYSINDNYNEDDVNDDDTDNVTDDENDEDVNGMLHIPCSIKMGMEDRSIQKFQITASSSETAFPPYNARPDLSGWCALLTDEKPYIQVDLLVTTVVDGITIFNWNETKESIISNTYQATIAPVGSRSFQLMYGSSLNKFVPYNNRSFQIDMSLKFNTEHHFVLYKPFVARYIRVFPLAIGTLPCLKFELYGCRKQGQPSVYCRNDTSAELFTDISISPTFGTRFAGYTDTQAEECFNKCMNETDKCSFFEYYRNFTSYRYMCNLYSTDEFKPLSGNDEFYKTQAKSSREIYYEEAFEYSAYRGIFMCWRNTTQFQVPRLNQRYTGLLYLNVSVILGKHQRRVIFNPGYPFYYDAPQIFSWAIHADNYIKIAFLDVSLKRPDNDNPCFINIATNKTCSNDVILLFKKQIDFGLLNNIEDGDLSIDYNSNGFNPMIRTDVRSLYMYFWTYRHEGEGRGFRALLFSEEHPDCGLPDWDQVYRCYEGSVRFASPELWQIPHSAHKYRFLYQPSIEDGYMPNIKVTFEVFDVSCNTDSSFTIKGRWINTEICNRNKPQRAMLLRLEMEITFTVATNREPYYPLEGFQILAQQINRENSSKIPSPSFFDNVVFECFDPPCAEVLPFRVEATELQPPFIHA